ncbi:hypothetical protein HMI55_002008 [Coelomomyces lativittatus]|nr:hypothetical protein HMI55_002008 [Coelomomyces lativittatus]
MALYTIEKVLEGIEMFGSSPKERITNSVNLWNSISSVLFPSAQSNDPVPLLATEVINSQPSLLESIRSIKKSPMLGHRLLKEYQRHLLQRFNFKTLPLIDQKLSEENTSNVNNVCIG